MTCNIHQHPSKFLTPSNLSHFLRFVPKDIKMKLLLRLIAIPAFIIPALAAPSPADATRNILTERGAEDLPAQSSNIESIVATVEGLVSTIKTIDAQISTHTPDAS